MPWIDRKKHWLPARTASRPAARPVAEKSFSVSETARLMSVSRQTVFKWLSADDDGAAVIPANAWYKLPGSDQIRIREWIIVKLQGGPSSSRE